MAKYYKRGGYGKKTYGKKYKRKSKYGSLQRLAFQMGQVERGRRNADSLISESYAKGQTEKERKPKKTLF